MVFIELAPQEKSITCIIKYKEPYVLSFIVPQLIIAFQKLEVGCGFFFFIKLNVAFPLLRSLQAAYWKVPVPSSSGLEGCSHPSPSMLWSYFISNGNIYFKSGCVRDDGDTRGVRNSKGGSIFSWWHFHTSAS